MGILGRIRARIPRQTRRPSGSRVGQALVEYALILALIAAGASVTMPTAGDGAGAALAAVADALTEDPKPGNPDPGPPVNPKPYSDLYKS